MLRGWALRERWALGFLRRDRLQPLQRVTNEEGLRHQVVVDGEPLLGSLIEFELRAGS